MKKSLLFAAVALLAVSAGNAQMKRSDMKVKKLDASVERVKELPKAKMTEAKMNESGKQVYASQIVPNDNAVAWYHRPAGAFYFEYFVDENGDFDTGFYAPFVVMKPYVDYTWTNASEGAESYQWLTQMYVYNNGWARQWLESDDTDLVTNFQVEYDSVPSLTAYGASGSDTYALYHNENEVNPRTGKVTTTTYLAHVAACATMEDMFGARGLGTSHFMGVRNRVDEGGITAYYGTQLVPHGTNQYGWYFGKNDSGLDGIAQIFEKPEHPYALLSVAILPSHFRVADEGGTLTANVYKVNVDNQFQPEAKVIITKDDLELLSTTTIDVDTATVTNKDFLIFPIMETFEGEDGEQLSFETSLHVDYPIMVEITGYNGEVTVNDEGNLEYADNGIIDFSGLVSLDEIDEGFGELAFVKRLKWYDDDGNILEEPYYQFEGLNYFFQSGAMKAGFAIYAEVELPFMVFNYTAEDGEYEFPAEGGSFHKTFGEGEDAVETDAIQIYSSLISEDWNITTVDGEDVPDWLTIEPEDIYEMVEETGEEEFSGLVEVSAEAAPLPEGVKGRECTVLFSATGAELTYHFIQGDPSAPVTLQGDVNGDGRVNVSDVSTLINMILGIEEMNKETADVNGDGKVNVSDVTALINIILGITA